MLFPKMQLIFLSVVGGFKVPLLIIGTWVVLDLLPEHFLNMEELRMENVSSTITVFLMCTFIFVGCGTPIHLTNQKQDDWNPFFSLDSSSKQVMVDMGLNRVGDILWSEDGSLLLFITKIEEALSIAGYEIYAVRADGSMLTHVAGPFETNPSARWLE